MKELKFILFLVFFGTAELYAANEFYVNQGVVIVNGTVAGAPTLFVNGDITNQNGSFTNQSGEIELKGDWRNFSLSNSYHSSGVERFSGATDQNIFGNWNGENQNSFYDLQISKSSSAGQYVSLHADVNVKDRIYFSESSGIIRTQPFSHLVYPGSGDYQYTISVLNEDIHAIQGHNVSNGSLTKYIEGKLRRAVGVTHADYYFPIGVAPVLTHISMDGMEAAAVRFHHLPAGNALTAYLREGVTSLINNVVFCDVGTDPSPDMDPFLSCVPGAGLDGIIDRASLVTASALEWSVTPDFTDDYNYRIEVFPGPILNSSVPILNISACGGPFSEIRYLAKDGIQGGDLSGPLSNGAPVWPDLAGMRVCPTGNVLNNQHSFSIFRIHGTENNMTELPVEFLNLYAEPVDNQYIQVGWKTASEKNISHYEVERSTDAVNFYPIGQVAGPDGGYSNAARQYLLEDKDVRASVLYYYRIKSVDFDGSYEYSYVVDAMIIAEGKTTISEIFPNPSQNGEGGFYVNTPHQQDIKTEIFNVLGQYLSSQNFTVAQGKTLIPLRVGNYPAGNYIVRISFEGEILSRKWIIQKSN